MVSEFTPPGIKIIALRTGFEIEAGKLYTVRGFVINRHWRTREPDPHVLLEEVARLDGRFGEIGYPRCAFDLPALPDISVFTAMLAQKPVQQRESENA